MNPISKIYDKLYKEFGPQGWWPIKNKYNKNDFTIPKTKNEQFEIILGAVLTQNTSWKNVENALKNLRRANLCSPLKILKITNKKLAKLIKPAGYFNQKADYLKNISKFIVENKNLSTISTKSLREKLLSVKGIGPETADSIILYAFKKPLFVVDSYTKRIFSRLGLCNAKTKYSELQNIFHINLSNKTELYNEYHALLVELAKKHCTNKPVCNKCPLAKSCKKHL